MNIKDYMIQTYCEKYDEGVDDWDIWEEYDYLHNEYVDKLTSDYRLDETWEAR